ncbi:hypothetical protein H4J46_02200 [Colwellia sp. MB02u-6]|uniref:hypothetical protein n=1 Tax=Colwellia sp. MB02u-6 TaxID=2759824 RepID=UPI0015F39CA5|nr:hypothetical protein [Colwellia sp. MB02u-6]MBA6326763.1 hypothetical protein [Colwellia sp. MB02u-6]
MVKKISFIVIVFLIMSFAVDTISQHYPVYSIAMQSGNNETLKKHMEIESY